MDESRNHTTEQRQQSSRMTAEQNWTMENAKQLKDKHMRNSNIRMDSIKRQRHLTCQVIKDIEQLWRETRGRRDKTDHLKTKTEHQQEDNEILKTEKHEENLLMKRLRLQIDNAMEKLKAIESEATQDKNNLQSMWAEIYQERKTLERRCNEIVTERHKLEMIMYDKTKSQEGREPNEPRGQIKQGQEKMESWIASSVLSLIYKNKKTIIMAMQAKEQVAKNMVDITQELKRNKNDIIQYRDQFVKIKDSMIVINTKMKQKWTDIQREIQVPKNTVLAMQSREDKDTFETVKMKLIRFLAEMEKLWNVLEDSEQLVEMPLTEKQDLKTETGQMEYLSSDSQNQRQDIDISLQMQKTEGADDMQRQRRDRQSALAQVQSERDEIERIKAKLQTERENLERERQLAKAEMDVIKCLKENSERQKQELDDKLQKTKKDIRDMELLKIEIEVKKQDLVKLIRKSKRKKEDFSMFKGKIKYAKVDLEETQDETEKQRSKQLLEVKIEDRFDEQKIGLQQVDGTREIIKLKDESEEDNMQATTENNVNSDLQRVILEVEDIRKMLHRAKEDMEKSRRDIAEEKKKIKWRNFQTKKRRWVLDQKKEKTMKERDELEILMIKIQRQREEVKRKMEDTIFAILTMGQMKANIEKDAEEINNTQEEMLKAQKKMEENKEEVKKHMDKLTSMKAWLSKWISTESTTKRTVSQSTVKPQELQQQTDKDSLKDQIPEILIDKGSEDEITKEFMSLRQSDQIQSDAQDQYQSVEIKEQEYMHSKHKQKQQLHFFAVDIKEERNIFIQTEIHEETSEDNDQTELAMDVREKIGVENSISKLRKKEEKIREQIKHAVKNMEEKNQEIRELIIDINQLQSQRPQTETRLENAVTETENVKRRGSGLLTGPKHKDILKVNTNVLKHELIKYEVKIQKEVNGEMVEQVTDESDLMRLDIERQKQSQELKEELQKHTEEIDGWCYKEDTKRDDAQRLRTEMHRTREIIGSMKIELESQAEGGIINRDHKDDSSETEGLLKDIKQFQELLKLVITVNTQKETHLKEEMSNIKLMKIKAKKEKRELDQRLERTLRERDELNILNIKIQRQNEVTEQKLKKMAKVRSTIEKMALRTRKKSKDIDVIMRETKVKLGHVEDLNNIIQITKKDLENSYILISQDLGKFETNTRQQKNNKTVLENTERENGGIRKHVRTKTGTERDKLTKHRKCKEIEEMENEIGRLRSKNKKLEEYMKLTMDNLDQKKCEIEQLKKTASEQVKQIFWGGEIEMLNQQIQVERESVRIARQKAKSKINEMDCLKEGIKRQKLELDDRMHTTNKEMREKELLNEIVWKEIQMEKRLLRIDTEKRIRKIDVRLEKTMRERDELEILRIKLHQQKEELTNEKQSLIDKTTLIQVYAEQEKKNTEEQKVKCIRERAEMAHRSSKVTNSITDLQHIKSRFQFHLKKMRGEMGILEDLNVHLGEQMGNLTALKAENKTVRHNLNRVRAWVKTCFENMILQTKTERDEMTHTREDIKTQNQELEITLEKIKSERREMEVLKSELEIVKRENQQIIRKGIQKERDVKNVWAVVREEKVSLERKTQIQKKKLDQRLEMIIRERDELEIKKLSLQRENNKSKDEIKQPGLSAVHKVQNQIQKHWELIQIYLVKYNFMIKRTEDLKREIEHETQHMEDQKNIIYQPKDEVEKVKMKIKGQKEIMMSAIRNMQHEKSHLEKDKKITVEEEELIGRHNKTKIENADEIQMRQKEIRGERKSQIWNENLEKLKEKLNKNRHYMDRVQKKINKMNKDLELMRYDCQKQADMLKQDKKDFQKERHKLDFANAELQEKKENLDSLFREISREKTNIKALTLQVQTKRDELQNAMTVFIAKQKEQELNEVHLKSQTQEVETSWTDMLAQREELEVLRKDLNKQRAEIDAAMKGIGKAREELFQMKTDIDKENELTEDKLIRQAQEVESSRTNVLAQREELEVLWKDLSQKKNEVEAAVTSVNEEREHMIKMKSENDKEREMILREKEKMEEERLELNMREDQFTNEMKPVELLRAKLQDLKEKLTRDMKHKLERWQQTTEDVQMMGNVSQQKLAEVEKKENLTWHREMFEREKEGLISKLSDLFSQRKDMESQWKQKIEQKEQHLENLKEELRQERMDLDRVNQKIDVEKSEMQLIRYDCQKQADMLKQDKKDFQKERHKLDFANAELQEKKENLDSLFREISREKTNIKALTLQVQTKRDELQNAMTVFIAKQKEQELNEVHLKSQTQEVETSWTDMLAQREELEVLRKDLNKQRAEIDAAMKGISEAREELIQMKTDIDKENELTEDKLIRQAQEVESSRTDVLAQREELEVLWKDLSQKKNEVEAAVTSVNEEREHMIKMKSENDKEREMILREKEKMEEERLELNMREDQFTNEMKPVELLRAKLQDLKEKLTRDMKHKLERWQQTTEDVQMMGNVSQQKLLELEKKKTETELSWLKIPADWLTHLIITMQNLKTNLKLINQKIHTHVEKNMDILEKNKEDILTFLLFLENLCHELAKQIKKINVFYYLIQTQREHITPIKVDKTLQTEGLGKEWLQEQLFKKNNFYKLGKIQYTQDVPRSDVAIQTTGFEHPRKSEKEKCTSLPESVAEQNEFKDKKMSETLCLQNIWKDTKIEQKEIGQMKHRGHEMKVSLEKRLQVISQLVKKTWSQNKEEPLEMTYLKQGQLQENCMSYRKTFDEKYTELQQLKSLIVDEVEKLYVKGKVSRTLKTTDKANQTSQMDKDTWNATGQLTEQALTKNYQETKAPLETTSGLLGQLRHYCCRCCCPCCACCKQECPEET